MKTSSKVHVAENGVAIWKSGATKRGSAPKGTSWFPPITELSLPLVSPCHETSKRVVLGLKDSAWALGSVESVEQQQNGAEADDRAEDQRVPPLPQVDPLDQIVDGGEAIWEGRRLKKVPTSRVEGNVPTSWSEWNQLKQEENWTSGPKETKDEAELSMIKNIYDNKQSK